MPLWPLLPARFSQPSEALKSVIPPAPVSEDPALVIVAGEPALSIFDAETGVCVRRIATGHGPQRLPLRLLVRLLVYEVSCSFAESRKSISAWIVLFSNAGP
jgi:hypothetical protein